MQNSETKLKRRIARANNRRKYYLVVALVLSLVNFWAYPAYPKDPEARNIRYLINTANMVVVLAASAFAVTKPKINEQASKL